MMYVFFNSCKCAVVTFHCCGKAVNVLYIKCRLCSMLENVELEHLLYQQSRFIFPQT